MSAQPIHLPLLVEAAHVVPLLNHPLLRIVDLSRPAVYEQVHLPNALALPHALLVKQEEHAAGLLPDPAQLQQLLHILAISPQHHVLVYDDEGGAWAGRLIWTLEALGFHQASLLNGGIHAWLAAGLPTSMEAFTPQPVTKPFEMQLNLAHRIELDELRHAVAQTDSPFNLWDCRSKEEYTGERLAARRGGHIPSAFHLEWSTALDRQNSLRIRPLEVIRQKLLDRGLDEQKAVVVYCQTHHRSGLAYVLARLLNLQVRAYDGAWSEWGNRLDTPIVTGEQPL